MKSVLIVALIAPGGYSAKPLIDAFLNNGFSDVRVFDYQLERFSIGKDLMQKKLLHEARQMKPDLIFAQIQGGDVVEFSELTELAKIAFTVNYTFDKRINEQMQWLYNLVPNLGLVCFSNQEDVDECNRRGYKNVMLLHSSANDEVYKPSDNTDRKGVVFIGNNFENTNMNFPKAKERREMVEFLKKEFPDDFHVFGLNWEGSGMTQPTEEVRIYSISAIAINQSNFDSENYTSDRLWRAMFCGVLCLTKYFKGIEKLFTRYEDLDWWETFDELKDKIDYYLANPEKTALIGSIGRQHVLANHTWSSRVKEMMAFIENNLMDTGEWSFPVVDGCTKMGAHVIDGKIPEPLDQHLDGRACDCGKLKYLWQECGCTLKEWQLRAQENI